MKKGMIYTDPMGRFYEIVSFDEINYTFQVLDLFYSRDGEEVIEFTKGYNEIRQFYLQVDDIISCERYGQQITGRILSIIYSKPPESYFIKAGFVNKKLKEGLVIELQVDLNTKRLFYNELKNIKLI